MSIFAIVWDFDFKEDEEYMDELAEIFITQDWKINYVELSASLDSRLARNKTPHRLKHKPSKRDLDSSEKALLGYEADYRMNSKEGEHSDKAFLRIDNTNLSPAQVASKIKLHFKL